MAQSVKTAIRMPHLAESLVDGTIGKWMKQTGDYVEEYEAICELITEKVTTEMPCPVEGTLVEIVADEGETVDVGGVICYIEEQGAAAVEADAPAAQTSATDAGKKDVQFAPSNPDQSMRKRYSPVVQKLAADHDLDLSMIEGSGLGGRITRKDVLAYIEKGGQQNKISSNAADAAADRQSKQKSAPEGNDKLDSHNIPVRTSGLHMADNRTSGNHVILENAAPDSHSEYHINVSPVRNTIASRMRQSVSEIPHAWTMIEVDVTNLVSLRTKLKEEFRKQEGINLTYLPFIMKAVVNAIKDYPMLNSIWAVDSIVIKRDINISLAVGAEDMVVTPVIKKADQKNIPGLAREMDDLVHKARSGKLSLDDMQGGTFTVNNTGSFGSILSYPIINYPQAAILTFESIVKKPVVIDDMIAVRSMANLCLSLDHRILDGVICGRFLQRVKENIESYTVDTKLY